MLQLSRREIPPQPDRVTLAYRLALCREPAEAESLRAGEPIKDLSALRALFTSKEAEDVESSPEAPAETTSED